jgi:hypothetical protein
MIKYHDGAVIEPASAAGDRLAPEAAFVGIILSGLATTNVDRCSSLVPNTPEGSTLPPEDPQVVYLTHGTIFGVTGCLSGAPMPGRGDVIASSKSQATHVFEIPKRVFDAVRCEPMLAGYLEACSCATNRMAGCCSKCSCGRTCGANNCQSGRPELCISTFCCTPAPVAVPPSAVCASKQAAAPPAACHAHTRGRTTGNPISSRGDEPRGIAAHQKSLSAHVWLQIEGRALAGNAESHHFLVSMYRLAAIQIVERFYDLFIATVADGWRTCGHQRRQWDAGRAPGRRRGRAAPAAQQPSAELEAVDVQCLWAALRSLLQCAQLHVMEPGASWSLSASGVLVRGSLEPVPVDQHGKPVLLDDQVATAPCMLLWASFQHDSCDALNVKAGATSAASLDAYTSWCSNAYGLTGVACRGGGRGRRVLRFQTGARAPPAPTEGRGVESGP